MSNRRAVYRVLAASLGIVLENGAVLDLSDFASESSNFYQGLRRERWRAGQIE
jgi:hypothetical protein